MSVVYEGMQDLETLKVDKIHLFKCIFVQTIQSAESRLLARFITCDLWNLVGH